MYRQNFTRILVMILVGYQHNQLPEVDHYFGCNLKKNYFPE